MVKRKGKCEGCNLGITDVNTFCVDCRKLYCGICSHIHRNNQEARDHCVISLTSGEVINGTKTINCDSCHLNPAVVLCQFCKETFCNACKTNGIHLLRHTTSTILQETCNVEEEVEYNSDTAEDLTKSSRENKSNNIVQENNTLILGKIFSSLDLEDEPQSNRSHLTRKASRVNLEANIALSSRSDDSSLDTGHLHIGPEMHSPKRGTPKSKQVTSLKTGQQVPVSMQFVEEIKIRCSKDKNPCYISGISFLGDGRVAIVDQSNKEIKVFNTEFKYIFSIPVNQNTWGMVVTDDDKLMVVEENKLITLQLDRRDGHRVDEGFVMDRHPVAISYASNKLAVLCTSPSAFVLMDTDGTNSCVRLINREVEPIPPYSILLGGSGERIYICDATNKRVLCFSTQGAVIWTCKVSATPYSVLMASNKLFVFCEGKIRRFDLDGQNKLKVVVKGKQLKTRINHIALDINSGKNLISTYIDNEMKVYVYTFLDRKSVVCSVM